MSGIVKDHRTRDTAEPELWACATDKFMSGWGQAPIASYVAYPIYSLQDELDLVRYMAGREDFIRVRVNLELPRVKDGYHLAIYDRPLDRGGMPARQEERKNETYNGWTNYETWNVALWLDNDYGLYHYWTGRAEELLEQCGGNKHAAARAFAKELRANVLSGHSFGDLTTKRQLRATNYQEVAEHFFEE